MYGIHNENRISFLICRVVGFIQIIFFRKREGEW